MRKHSTYRKFATLGLAAASCVGSVGLASCSSDGKDSGASKKIVVWDYYGSATPVKPAIEAYKKKHPGIKVDYQVYDYDTFQEKLSTAFSSNSAPDLATIDMTWVPTYASQGVLSDISEISKNKLNGKSIDSQYSKGALKAMTYEGHKVVLSYDFDVYSLYYRADILKAKGLEVPKTWEDLLKVSKAMAQDTNGDGKVDKYGFQVRPDTFQYSQFLFQNGGSIVDKSGKKAAFSSTAGVEALKYMQDLMKNGGVMWDPSQGDSTGLPGIADERIGMFLNGPYLMGVLKTGVPNQAGKWAVAPAPFAKKQGSYLGGTALAIPTGAKNTNGAWDLMQFLLKPEQQELVYTKAGAAPATTAALKSKTLTAPDSFFYQNQEPFSIFEEALKTATPFPYVSGWPEIDKAMTDAVTAALRGKKTPEQALKDAAKTSDKALKK